MRIVAYISIFVILSFGTLRAQQIPVFSGMGIDEYVYNPAFAGAHPYLSASLKQRLQYLGVDYAPNTQLLSVESSISGTYSGVGGYFLNETNGILGKMQGMASYAYHIPLSEETSLSFGASVGIHQLRTLSSRMILHAEDDNLLNTQANQRNSFFNSQVGTLIHNDMFYIGYALLNTLTTAHDIYAGSNLPQRFHHHIHYGFNFYSGNVGMITITGRNVFVPGLPSWHQFGFLYDHDETFYGGIQYRWQDALVGMIGVKVWDELRIYYSYDLGVGGYRSANSGSHELSITYQFHYDPIYSKDKARYTNKVYRGWKFSFKRKPKMVSPVEQNEGPEE